MFRRARPITLQQIQVTINIRVLRSIEIMNECMNEYTVMGNKTNYNTGGSLPRQVAS